jgi:hypothetical protein
MPTISPAGSRRALTAMSFSFTLIVTWPLLTPILAPVMALYTAYYVYHSIATSDNDPEKVKHTTKNTLSLEENDTKNTPIFQNISMKDPQSAFESGAS